MIQLGPRSDRTLASQRVISLASRPSIACRQRLRAPWHGTQGSQLPVAVRVSAGCDPVPRTTTGCERTHARRRPAQVSTCSCRVALSYTSLLPRPVKASRAAHCGYVRTQQEMRSPTLPDTSSTRISITASVDGRLANHLRHAVTKSSSAPLDRNGNALRISAVVSACRLIEKRFPEPVTLSDLSRHCGVAERTLEYGFKQVYDTTPLAFARNQRLTRSRMALLRAAASVLRSVRLRGLSDLRTWASTRATIAGFSVRPHP